VTFGSVVGGLPEAGAVYRAALQAAGTLPVRVLLTVGSTFDPATLGPIPANAHVEPWVAQEDVLAEAALVICHGGSGTVLGALASGVPLVVCPLFADQSANAGMVQDAGAGVVVTSKRPAPAVSLRSARTTYRHYDAPSPTPSLTSSPRAPSGRSRPRSPGPRRSETYSCHQLVRTPAGSVCADVTTGEKIGAGQPRFSPGRPHANRAAEDVRSSCRAFFKPVARGRIMVGCDRMSRPLLGCSPPRRTISRRSSSPTASPPMT
jgi:hypothetical protein